MDIGIGLLGTIPGADGATFREWSRRADARHFSSLSIIDRLVSGNFDSMITLAVAAGTADARGRVSLNDYYAFDPRMGPLIAGSILVTPDATSNAIRDYADVGVDEITFWPTMPDLEQVQRLEEFVD